MPKQPLEHQDVFVDTIANLINAWLSMWPRKSGKTEARKMLAARILRDDNAC